MAGNLLAFPAGRKSENPMAGLCHFRSKKVCIYIYTYIYILKGEFWSIPHFWTNLYLLYLEAQKNEMETTEIHSESRILGCLLRWNQRQGRKGLTEGIQRGLRGLESNSSNKRSKSRRSSFLSSVVFRKMCQITLEFLPPKKKGGLPPQQTPYHMAAPPPCLLSGHWSCRLRTLPLTAEK